MVSGAVIGTTPPAIIRSEMAVGEVDLVGPEHALDHEAVAKALRVAAGGILGSDDLAG